jgi:hypothetical protein
MCTPKFRVQTIFFSKFGRQIQFPPNYKMLGVIFHKKKLNRPLLFFCYSYRETKPTLSSFQEKKSIHKNIGFFVAEIWQLEHFISL